MCLITKRKHERLQERLTMDLLEVTGEVAAASFKMGRVAAMQDMLDNKEHRLPVRVRADLVDSIAKLKGEVCGCENCKKKATKK